MNGLVVALLGGVCCRREGREVLEGFAVDGSKALFGSVTL